MGRILKLTVFAVFFATPAYAYVDPGFLGSLYQMVYMLIFGVFAGWVLRPYRYLTSLFQKLKSAPEKKRLRLNLLSFENLGTAS